MELKCELYMIHRIESASSNRTFMELKLNFTRRRARWRLSSNRTFMELKSPKKLGLALSHGGSNRTFMELKLLLSRYLILISKF